MSDDVLARHKKEMSVRDAHAHACCGSVVSGRAAHGQARARGAGTAVAAVQASFERNQIRPGDAGYVHDKRIAFDEPKEAVSAAPVRPLASD